MYKIIITILLSVFLFTGIKNLNSQTDTADAKAKFREIIKNKLIENVGVNENTAEKIILLSVENRRKINGYRKRMKELRKTIEENTNDPNISSKLDELLELDITIAKERKAFVDELKTYLTTEQIVKTIKLEKKLTKVLKKEIRDKKRGKRNK